MGVDFTYGDGHALNAFKTTDKGIVYVDCTSVVKGIVWIPELGEYLPRDAHHRYPMIALQNWENGIK